MIRNASLELPSEKTVQTASAPQNARGRRCGSAVPARTAPPRRASRTERRRTSVRNPGATATISTVRSETPAASSATASSGPATAPAVSSARWRPGGLAEPVADPRCEDDAPGPRRRERDPRDGGRRVARDDPHLARAAGAVGEPARGAAKADGDALRDPLDDAEHRRGRAERLREEQRHDRIHELAREVVRERDPGERAHVLREPPLRSEDPARH